MSFQHVTACLQTRNSVHWFLCNGLRRSSKEIEIVPILLAKKTSRKFCFGSFLTVLRVENVAARPFSEVRKIDSQNRLKLNFFKPENKNTGADCGPDA